ncbi:MAG TPA: ribokinase [Clostridia bacterium]|nr:ribokinase [Clostridia bacterium]
MYKKPRLLVVGSFVMDLIVSTGRVPASGETVIDGLSFTTAPGGKGANQAVQAARLGAQVTMIGKVGKDMFGDQLLSSVRAAGVDTASVLIDEKTASGIGNIILEVKPDNTVENRIVVVPGANMKLTAGEIGFISSLIPQYDMLMLELEIPMEVNEAAASYAFEKGIPVMLNPAPAAKLSDSLLSKLTFISPNEHEAAELTGVRIKKIGDTVDMDTVRAAAEVLLGRGVKNVIITLGECGAAYMNRDRFIYRPCVEGVEAVDPTAAGDSFTGAFCTGICMGLSEERALEFAGFAAALTVSGMGAQPSLPGLDEVKRLMEVKGCLQNG